MKRLLLALNIAIALCLSAIGSASFAQQGAPQPAPGQGGAAPPGAPRDGAPRVRLPGVSLQISLGSLFALGAPRGDEAFEPGQLLVMWNDEASARDGLLLLEQRGLRPLQSQSLAELGTVLALYQLADYRAARALRDELRAQQPLWTIDLNARAWPLQREANGVAANVNAVSAAGARLYARQLLGVDDTAPTSSTTRLGVIDGSIDGSLLAPAAARVWNGSQIASHSVLASTDTAAGPAHGTAVALLMAAAPLANGFAGAAPALHIAWAGALRKLGAHDSSNSWLLAQAFNWLLGERVQLVNVSLGGAGDEVLRAVTARVLTKGVAVLAAAGNSADTASVYPGAYPGVWAVTAIDAAGQPYRHATRAQHVAFAAPGVDVWVPDAAALLAAMLQGASASASASASVPAAQAVSGRYLSGTSFATALASAALARMPAAFWQLDADTRKSRLCAAARAPLQGVVPGGVPGEAPLGCGSLRVDAAAAASALSAKLP